MDIATGLTLLSQATGIVKNLREIDKGFDAAALKAQMADVYGALADVKIALSDARETIQERDQTIKELENKIAALVSGEPCPICTIGRMRVQERLMKCDICGHEEKHFHDPNITKKRR